MQRLSVKLQFLQDLAVRLSRTAIDGVADQWMADGGHVDADLVRSAGLKPAFDQCGLVQDLEPLPAGDRALAAAARHDGDLLAVRGRTGERGVHNALRQL